MRNITLVFIGLILIVGMLALFLEHHKPPYKTAQIYGLSSGNSTPQVLNKSSDNSRAAGSYSAHLTTPSLSNNSTQTNSANNIPSYTPNPISQTYTNNSSNATPNPSLCPDIKSQEQIAIASLVTQNQQLEILLTNENNAGETAQAQQTTNQIIANSNKISSIEAPYITQLVANECSL